jgi:hypothetical protein
MLEGNIPTLEAPHATISNCNPLLIMAGSGCAAGFRNPQTLTSSTFKKKRTHLSKKRKKYTYIVTSQNDLFSWRIEFFLVEAVRAQTPPVLRFLI